MLKSLRIFAPLVLFILLAAPALAQGSLAFYDENGNLDQAKVAAAAQPLVDRGARVAIYNVLGGSQNDFQQRLIRDGLARADGSVRNELIGLYVSTNPNFIYIRQGDNWNSALSGATNQIIDGQMKPQLIANDYNAAFVNGLNAVNSAISGGRVPSTSSGGTATSSSNSGGSAWPWIIGAAALGGAGYFGYRALRGRNSAAAQSASAKGQYEDARRQSGAAIAEFAQQLRDAQDKAKFDAVSYPEADVAALKDLQGQAETEFLTTQQSYKDIEDGLIAKAKPSDADYKQAAEGHLALVPQVESARGKLDQAQNRRTELDKIGAGAPEAVDKAKREFDAVAGQLGTLSDVVTDPAAAQREAHQKLAAAEQLLQQRHNAEAIPAAAEASAAIAALGATVARFGTLREQLSAGRAGAEKAATEGYRVDAGLAALDRGEKLLAQAGLTLQRDGVAAADKVLDEAATAAAEGEGRGGGMAALKAENETRLSQVQQAGEQIDEYIAEGKRAFDQTVDGFAESSWSDIRGNGSEAEAAAAAARQLWDRAGQRNTADMQDFYGAKQDLDAADQKLGMARQSIDAVIGRLKDLGDARDVAKAEIADAEKDIAAGWSFVKQNDPDVGKAPEQLLTQAQSALDAATAEMQQAKPNWLALVKHAREANRLADQALAGARSELDAMNKLRDEATRAKQIASAEVQKIVQFAKLHTNDLPAESLAGFDALNADLKAADAALQRADHVAEEARTNQLSQARDAYVAVHDRADELYNQVYSTFQRGEQLRGQVQADVDAANQAIQSAESVQARIAAYLTMGNPGEQRLTNARKLLASIGPMRDEAEAEQARKLAAQARDEAVQAQNYFNQTLNELQQSQRNRPGGGGMMTGMLIGGMMSGGRGHSGSWGGGGGGGWGGGMGGGGGGGWGSGGGGGGSWGGGGGSGGGW